MHHCCLDIANARDAHVAFQMEKGKPCLAAGTAADALSALSILLWHSLQWKNGGWIFINMMERVEALFLFATLLLLFFVDRGSPKLFEILIWNDLDLYNIINSHAILYTLKFGRLNLYLVISGLWRAPWTVSAPSVDRSSLKGHLFDIHWQHVYCKHVESSKSVIR